MTTLIQKLANEIPKCGDRKSIWEKQLGLKESYPKELAVFKAVLGAGGQFNFWEGESHKSDSSEAIGSGSDKWFAVVRGDIPIYAMNLVQTRIDVYKNCLTFLACGCNPLDKEWWEGLHKAYGYDPLRKRETLCWMILKDLGVDVVIEPPAKGCVDYNLIVALRHLGIVTAKGNVFDTETETELRKNCLLVCEQLLVLKPELTVMDVDSYLYNMGKHIRKTVSNWADYFCYRVGCYYY